MICFSIAFNSQRKTAGVLRSLHSQVNEVASHANLTFRLKPCPLKNSLNLNFKRRVALFAGCLTLVNQNAALGVFEKQMKIADALLLAIKKNLIAPNGRENFHPPFGSCNENIESAFATFTSYRAESLSRCPAGRMRPVSARENHNVPLIALDVFEVADKERFFLIPAFKELASEVEAGIFFLHFCNEAVHAFHLVLIHCDDTDGQAILWRLCIFAQDKLANAQRNCICFQGICHLANGCHSIGNELMANTEFRMFAVGVRKKNQGVVVRKTICRCNECFMPTAIMPFQL